MIVGIFLVGFSHVRSALDNPRLFRTGLYWRNSLILSAILVFTAYGNLSWAIEFDVPGSDVEEKALLSPKALILFLVPLDLIMVASIGGMFLALSRSVSPDDSNGDEEFKKWDQQPRQRARSTIAFLFTSCIVWHGACILWWFAWFGTPRFNWTSIVFHVTATSVHLLLLLVWLRVTSVTRSKRITKKLEWAGTLAFCIVVFSVYFIRMSWYLDVAIANFEAQTSRPNAEKVGARQPATAVESKPEDAKKPNRVLEERAQ
ncbi:MAG: hypothetical protein AAGC74_10545 [Verrucomicrobiota bacterium]